MSTLHNIESKLAIIKEQIEQRVHHPYLLRFIQTPIIDEDKLLLLISIMDQLELTEMEIKNYSLTTMLIQIALDTHDYVSNLDLKDHENDDQKKHQLTVLAGDYYSGLYYKLLAETNNLALIRTLAEGVKDINEHKIFIYQQEQNELDKIMNSFVKIEASLIEKLSDYFKAPAWKELSNHILFVKRLFVEKNKFIQQGRSILFEVLKKHVFPNNKNHLSELTAEQNKYLLNICDRYIDHTKQAIEKDMNKVPALNELLEKRIFWILNQHHSLGKTFVEEG
ncbi:heptaprenyl diphosphate synthase component 1 [Bacillus aquiflavi]|uniref:heptaprenyl diphosphate synthase component 1 n=1 Tax=Bacillus aquiflavi TaxID=2672567 RepID=UPI0028681BC4|nr:heptaprenyl diphosphate synthase component 1 [Bacillus aquiflavi]